MQTPSKLFHPVRFRIVPVLLALPAPARILPTGQYAHWHTAILLSGQARGRSVPERHASLRREKPLECPLEQSLECLCTRGKSRCPSIRDFAPAIF